MLKRLLYIAGPFTDPDPIHGTARNILEASAIALEAWRAGWATFCPHLNTAGFQFAADIPPEVFYEGDLEILRRCDAVLMIPGYTRSKGAIAELLEADRLGIPVYIYEASGMPIPSKSGVLP